MERLTQHTRWPEWEFAVLAKVGSPQSCQKLIARRQNEVDDDQDESHLVACFIREKLREAGRNPETCYVFVRSRLLATWFAEATGEKLPVNKVTPYLKAVGIPELQSKRLTDAVGWVWRGSKVKPNEGLVDFETGRLITTRKPGRRK